ncbi:mandelate racemase/muconate lactonizing enzyme family protein [Roseomonas sp. OT10]|uniref:mandelate racemase/muconate lactonizing enzyme family protein n=1 Tax=Roseomonas cutis TaxID=2897332 RepID=UPI001E429ACE|nr:mandelate racemase/muconate lactonizing enzyme family protein [Roseomonas sp. OT10]UFN49680.1 mandelate racemase/muconate lactonizing enzyme family protein [Roseomonas sp. OT10]
MDDLRIASVRHWLVRVPFRKLIEWGSGTRSGATRLVVRIETAGGVVGWGESICLLDAIPAVLERIVAPLALQHRADEAEALHRHVLGAGYYHHKRAAVMAMAAVEMAMWDALGRATGRPLHALWGGRFREKAEMVAYLLAADPGAAAETAAEFLRQGHRSFKVKIGMSEATDIPLVRAVREAVGDAPLRADVNGAWTPGTARRQLHKLLPYDLAWVEQPLELDDLLGHAELRRAQPVPIALDESAYTLQDVGNIVRMGAADVVLLDPHEAGGLWPVVKQAAICESAGIPVTLHSGGELGLSQSAYLHLAASIPNMSLSIDTEHTYLGGDIVAERFTLEEGCFRVPTGPGLGVTVDEDALRRFSVERIEGAYLDPARPGWFPLKPAY